MRNFGTANDRSGSFASIWHRPWVRSSPHSGHLGRTVHSTRRATSGCEQSQQVAILLDDCVAPRKICRVVSSPDA